MDDEKSDARDIVGTTCCVGPTLAPPASATSASLLIGDVLAIMALQGARHEPPTWAHVLAPHCLTLCRGTMANNQLWRRLVDFTMLPDGETRLMHAVRAGDALRVEFLAKHGAALERRSRDYMTPLMVACSTGRRAVVRVLLAHGAAVDAVDKTGRTPLHIAAARGHGDIIRDLVAAGANVDLPSRLGGYPAIILASVAGHADAVVALVECGADVNARSTAGWTALLRAVNYGQLEVTRALLSIASPRSVVAIDAVCPLGKTALEWARYRGDAAIERALLAVQQHRLEDLVSAARVSDDERRKLSGTAAQSAQTASL